MRVIINDLKFQKKEINKTLNFETIKDQDVIEIQNTFKVLKKKTFIN